MTYDALKIGDLVTLKSHAYVENLTSIIITGDHNSLPPIMMIKEIYRIKNNNNSTVDHFIFKCIWFSSGSNTLQEGSFKDVHLKAIKNEETLGNGKVTIDEGDMVLLKSTTFELKKRKSTFSVEEGSFSNADSKNTQSALLTYLPPVFHVISIKDFIPKNTSKKSFTKDYWHCNKKVKCFYYNNHNDKISEIEFPIEVLELLEPLSESILKEINSFISDKSHILWKGEEDETLILQPKLISFRSGFYFLRSYDVVKRKNIDVNILNDSVYKKIDDIIKFVSPKADMSYLGIERIIEDLIAKIKVAHLEKLYLRIKYKNKNDEISIRTISRSYFQENPIDKSNLLYLTGYCHLRNEERTFYLKRIQYLEVLTIPYL
ncbi:hypothetical protein DBR43_17070 [Pedobacter sp. KBW06]|uniref:WYL domain-containing protein n=1 Tax=Pedobacter sp. KBW06 TaxID=2153359 RepID=UPI000F5A3CC8|nr:WYL domain-containing protein [Pedobacter sp. KBW06]RQO69770.1 hypothetical protein DBR43_17070 [Pedobacter sp. KBW06]